MYAEMRDGRSLDTDNSPEDALYQAIRTFPRTPPMPSLTPAEREASGSTAFVDGGYFGLGCAA